MGQKCSEPKPVFAILARAESHCFKACLVSVSYYKSGITISFSNFKVSFEPNFR